MTPDRPAQQRLRLFVAVELPPTWLEALESAQAALRRDLEAGGIKLRWVRPEGIHLTLKFLGEVAAANLSLLEKSLGSAVDTPPGLNLRLGAPGFFASGRRVRHIWCGVEGDLEGLARLAERVDASCAAIGFAPERRPLAPHLTLARVPEGLSLERGVIEPHLKRLRLAAPPMTVESVSLMRSHLGAGGSRYERLASFPAAGPS